MDVNNRRSRRIQVYAQVDYSYSYVDNEQRLNCDSSCATTTNISQDGMGMISGKYLERGQELVVFGRDIFDTPKKALVRWCDEVAKDLFRVGLEFA